MRLFQKYLLSIAVSIFAMHAAAFAAEDEKVQEVVSTSGGVSGYSVVSRAPDYDKLSEQQLWDMGNSAYASNDYVGAERAYQAILSREMHSAALYYNLGSVYHRLGRVGRSLLYLYKAQRLAPSDRDVAHNIEVVKASTVDDVEELPTLFVKRWAEWISTRFSLMGWSVISIVSLLFALSALLIYLFSVGVRFRRIGFGFAALFLICFLISTSYALDARDEVLSPSEAVVLSARAAVMSAPDSSSAAIFYLHEGTKVALERDYGDWCEVRLGDGKQGWIEMSNLGLI